jgi:hypothetical protein
MLLGYIRLPTEELEVTGHNMKRESKNQKELLQDL